MRRSTHFPPSGYISRNYPPSQHNREYFLKKNNFEVYYLKPNKLPNLKQYRNEHLKRISKKRIGFSPSKNVTKTQENNSILRFLGRTMKNYLLMFLNTSSIHGLNHLTSKNRHPLEFFFWLIIVVSALFGVIFLSIGTWQRYQDNPTVISMERDRFSWNTSFPAATICPSSKVNEEKLKQEISKSDFKDKNKAIEFIAALLEVNYRNLNQIEIPDFDEIQSKDYLKYVMKYGFVFEPTVSNSGTEQYSLEQVILEMGLCYSFNSQLARYLSYKYWQSNSWDMISGNDTFYVHPLDGEVFANAVNMLTGFDMYIHGPEEIVDIGSKNIYSENGYFLQVYVSAMTLFSSEATKDLKIRQRKCRFAKEANLPHFPVYSYNLCQIECRIQLCIKYCGCLPHFYRPVAGDKICNAKGLRCLAKYINELISLTDENGNSLCKLKCLPNCDGVNYVKKTMDTRKWFLGSNLQWGLKEYPTMRLKRDVLFGFTDVLVYVGGMAGLFLGCSVLSFVEIIYFFTIRLFWFNYDHLKGNKLEWRKNKDSEENIPDK